MQNFLSNMLATITGKPRYFPEVKWSKNLWTHNVFRVWESLVGRKYGIKPSMFSANGVQYAYSFEAQIALFEVWVRSLFKKFSFKIVYVPQMQLAGLSRGGYVPYRFAIALDTSGQSTNPTTSYSYTSTGSDLVMVLGLTDDTGANPNPTATYNSVSMTLADEVQYPGDRWNHLFVLAGPATGSNTIAIGSTSFRQTAVATYTGCNQTGQPDSHSATTTVGTPWVQSTTVVASNCWLVGFVYGTDPLSTTVTPGVLRQTVAASSLYGDSNGTVSTGSQSLTWNNNGVARVAVGVMVSIKPVAADGPANLKSLDTNVKSNIKSVNTNPLANVKSLNTNP